MNNSEKERILKLIKIEKELGKRRGKKRLQTYNSGEKVHEKQLAFHKCLKRNRWVFGGNRSGKTECGAVETVWMLRGIHPYRENKPNVSGWAVSVSYEVQRDVAQQKILSYLSKDWIAEIVMQSGKKDSPETGVIDQIVVKNVFGGFSRLGFKSADQGREKFQGASLDFVWFDEEPPEDVYRECQMRVLDKKGDIFGTMTPLKGQTWVYDEIYLNKGQSPEVWYEQMEWADNPYLDEKEVEMLSNSLSDDVKDSRRYGRFKTYNGLVYPEFDVNVHVIEPFSVPEEWQADISIDPGLNNPLSCHFYAVDGDGTVYVVAEHFEAGKEVDYHVRKINELAEKIGWKRDARGRLHALIDSAANQKTLASSKSVTELFVEKGIVVNPKVNKDLFSGIAKIKNMLAARPPKILIFSSCVNLIRELKSYAWAEGDRPKKFDDHALDELRYFVMSGALPQAVKPQKTEIQKDIESLIKLQKRNRQ